MHSTPLALRRGAGGEASLFRSNAFNRVHRGNAPCLDDDGEEDNETDEKEG